VAWSPDGLELASASRDTTVLIWAVSPATKEPSLRLELSETNACWTALAGDDAAKAYQAMHTLAGGAQQSVPFLAERLKPITAPDARRVAQLIEDLDDNRYAVRQKATAELEGLGELAEQALRKKLAEKPSAEVRRRIEWLLARPNREQLPAEALRSLRALQVLERIGSSEAKQVLETLAGGAEGCPLTREARASLDRLQKSGN
jgi:hypothetical protein